MSKERSSGFELLRLLCIFGILMMHTFAGIDPSASVLNTEVHVLVNSLFNTGVTCFILISGYFGIKFNFKKLVSLDLMIIFFTICGTLLLDGFAVSALVKSALPVLTKRYWFISCYFVLCFLAPFLNKIPEKLSREAFRNLLLVLLLLFSIVPTFGFYDIMQDAGKGLVDFIMIYLLGRYLALYHNTRHQCSHLTLGLLLSVGIVFVLDSALTLVKGTIYTTFSRDCSIFIIFASVMLLLLFRELSFQSKLINRAASNVLAIYVLDETLRALLGHYITLNDFASSWYLVFVVMLFVIVVMFAAILLNELRKFTIGRLEPLISDIVDATGRKLYQFFENALNWIVGKFMN